MNTIPQITSALPKIRMPAWRSASPKKWNTRPLKMSPKASPQKRMMSPKDAIQSLAGFWATFFANASVTDLWGSVVKTTMFGAIIAIVCCYKGMTASGGAAGVGRAVNEAVVIAFAGIWAFNYVFTQTLLATHPEILVIR